MGFLDKLKNTFFEEEYVEVEEKPKKQVVSKKVVEEELPKKEVIRKEVRKEIKEPVKEVPVEHVTLTPVEVKKDNLKESNELKKKTGFNYFDEDDFLDFDDYEEKPKQTEKVSVKEESKKLYDNPVYGSKKIVTTAPSPYQKDTKPLFRPTPIISPIYGVLDKNYKKEEIIDKKEIKPSSSYVSTKNVDLDSVRNKAFGGSLQDDFNLVEEQEIKKEANIEEIEDDGFEDNLLYDMTEPDKTPSVDKVTLQDAEEYFSDLGLEYNIDYKDAKYEKATGRRVNKTPIIDEYDEDEITEPINQPRNDAPDNDSSSQSLEDNLFDLIDSMYEEKE